MIMIVVTCNNSTEHHDDDDDNDNNDISPGHDELRALPCKIRANHLSNTACLTQVFFKVVNHAVILDTTKDA